MSRYYIVRTIGCLVASAFVSGCKDVSARIAHRSAPASKQFVKQHGVVVGDQLAAVTLQCADGSQRVVGSGRQLITFARPDDYCESCHHHLLGVAEMWRKYALGDSAILVAYAPPARRVAALREYRDVAGAPLCFDEAGAFWNSYHLVTTPFTVLLVNGRIEYANDVALDDSTQQSLFLRGIKHPDTP